MLTRGPHFGHEILWYEDLGRDAIPLLPKVLQLITVELLERMNHGRRQESEGTQDVDGLSGRQRQPRAQTQSINLN